jgi:hypothetical protein
MALRLFHFKHADGRSILINLDQLCWADVVRGNPPDPHGLEVEAYFNTTKHLTFTGENAARFLHALQPKPQS